MALECTGFLTYPRDAESIRRPSQLIVTVSFVTTSRPKTSLPWRGLLLERIGDSPENVGSNDKQMRVGPWGVNLPHGLAWPYAAIRHADYDGLVGALSVPPFALRSGKSGAGRP